MRVLRWIHERILFMLLGRKSKFEIHVMDGQIHAVIHFMLFDTMIAQEIKNPKNMIIALIKAQAELDGLPAQLINTDFISGQNNAQNLDAH